MDNFAFFFIFFMLNNNAIPAANPQYPNPPPAPLLFFSRNLWDHKANGVFEINE